MIIAVIVLVVLSGLGVIASGRRRRRNEPDSEAADVVPSVTEIAPGTDLVLLEDEAGSCVVIEPVDELPKNLEPLPSNLAPRLLDETIRAAPHLQRVAVGRGHELYRVVKVPPGGLQRVAGGSPNVRGWGMQGGHISGHAEFRKAPPVAISPALVLTLASAAIGAHWQQQMDATLRDIKASLDSIRSRLDLELDAKLDLAERVLGEHEAAPPDGRYEPPASITDGLQANLIERRHLHRLLAQLESREGPRMRHRDYQTKVLTIDGERLDEHVYRALRGLFVELRVLRLKRLGGLLENDDYQEQLDQQEQELRHQLGTIEGVLTAALYLDGSRRADGRRPELPKARRRRQLQELEHTIQGRKQLAGLRELTDRLLMAATSPSLDDEPLELLVGNVDGQPRAYALPLSPGEP